MSLINLVGASALAASGLGMVGALIPERGDPAPSAFAAIEPAPVPGATTLSRSRDGLFYVTAYVNEQPVRFVVDTGANLVVLTAADARRVGVSGGTSRHRLETVSGRSAMRSATLDHLRVGDQHMTNTRAAVVGTGLRTSLLGQNALSQLESVTLKGDRLELR